MPLRTDAATVHTATACRSCGDARLEVVLSLGDQPPANAFLEPGQLGDPEKRYPLDLAICESCGLVQLTVSLDPGVLFGDYPYFTSMSDTMVGHAASLAARTVRDRGLGPDSLVLEIASNDGYLLRQYARRGIPVLGVEPARNVADTAMAAGVPTRCAFFGEALAGELTGEGVVADVVHANNVLAHVPDLNGVLRGVARMLAPDGVFIAETPSLADLVDGAAFDTIYHEHLFYYSLSALSAGFERAGLVVVSVERIPVHGGSLRVFATHAGAAEPDETVTTLRNEEGRRGLLRADGFAGFAARVGELRRWIPALIADLRAEGRAVAAYGAAAKGTVLLNACGLGADQIMWVADRSPHKQGRFVPGVHVPVVSPERILADRPDHLLLLAWNIADEVMAQQAEYRAGGGRFIRPLPVPEVIE